MLTRRLRGGPDALVFEQDERGPDEEIRHRLQTFATSTCDEHKAAATLHDARILKH